MFRQKYKMGKEIALACSSIFILILITILTSFINCGFDFKKMFSDENTFNLVTNANITIMGIASSIPLGIVITKQLKNADGTPGRYIQEYTAFHEIRQKIEPKRKLFGQWHTAQYLKECREKQFNYLLKHNILQPEYVLKLNIAQIKTLTVARRFSIDGVEVTVNALSKRQINACVKVLNGEVVVHKLPDFYFLYIDNVSNDSFYDVAYKEHKIETNTILAKVISKVALGFIISCILTGFLYDLKNIQFTSNYVMAAVLLTLVRIFNAVSSIFAGICAGQEFVYKLCYFINGKTQFLKIFDTEVSDDTKHIPLPKVETHEVIDLTEEDLNGK